MTDKRVITNHDELRAWCSTLYKKSLPMRVAASEGNDRSLSQNAIAHKWFSEVGHQMGESADEVKLRAKLDIGTIILCRDDEAFLAFCREALGDLGREQRLTAMKYIDVTSIMTVKQMTEFLDTFERQHRAAGMTLTIPEAA